MEKYMTQLSEQIVVSRDELISAVIDEELGEGATRRILGGDSALADRVKRITFAGQEGEYWAIDDRKVLWMGEPKFHTEHGERSVIMRADVNYKDLR